MDDRCKLPPHCCNPSKGCRLRSAGEYSSEGQCLRFGDPWNSPRAADSVVVWVQEQSLKLGFCTSVLGAFGEGAGVSAWAVDRGACYTGNGVE